MIRSGAVEIGAGTGGGESLATAAAGFEALAARPWRGAAGVRGCFFALPAEFFARGARGARGLGAAPPSPTRSGVVGGRGTARGGAGEGRGTACSVPMPALDSPAVSAAESEGFGSEAVIRPNYQAPRRAPAANVVGRRRGGATPRCCSAELRSIGQVNDKVHRIHSLPTDAPWAGGLPPTGSPEHPRTIRALDRVMAIQRPVVLAHLRSIRVRHPAASTAEIVRILERRYLTAVTAGGAAVGATAVVPGVGTGVTLALSGVETVGFLESTTLFAQSIAEVHGVAVEDPDRARALVLTLMLGTEGVDLLAQLASQAAGKGPDRSKYWGQMVTKTLPRAAVGPVVDRLKTAFVHQFAARGGASFLGKALPFGVGAVVGGAGNNILGRRVLVGSRRAFGPPPLTLPVELEPRPGSAPLGRAAVRSVGRLGNAIAGAAGGAVRNAGAAGRRALPGKRKKQEGNDAEAQTDQTTTPPAPRGE